MKHINRFGQQIAKKTIQEIYSNKYKKTVNSKTVKKTNKVTQKEQKF